MGGNIMIKRLGSLLLIVVGCAVGLVLVEIAARVLEQMRYGQESEAAREERLLVRDIGAQAKPIHDERLSLRLPPNTPGHDANGFRNDAVPEQVDVVAIGDSQTWGVNAGPSQTWPAVFAKLSGRSIYSMAHGYYGPIDYMMLAEDAQVFRPRTVVIALYMGNDILQSYTRVYVSDFHRALRSQEFIDRPEGDPLNAPVFRRHEQFIQDRILSVSKASHVSERAQWLMRVSALARLLQQVGIMPGSLSWGEIRAIAAADWARESQEDGLVLGGGKLRTVLTQGYRLATLDRSLRVMPEAERLTVLAIQRAMATIRSYGAQPVLAIVPTKELVYARALPDGAWRGNTKYLRLVENEEAIKASIAAMGRQAGGIVIDLAPPFVEAIRGGQALYRQDDDGHPMPAGYRVIGETIEQVLGKTR